MNTFLDKRLINLYSANGTKRNGTLNSQIQYAFTNLLHDKDLAYAEVGVINAEIPVSFYTINEYNNNLYVGYATGGGLKGLFNVELDYGNYTANTFITELLAKLSSAISYPAVLADDLEIVINKTTGKLGFRIVSTTHIDDLEFLKEDGTGLPSKIFTLMGFTVDFICTTTLQYTPFPLNLLGTNKLTIKSDNLATYNYDSRVSGFSNVLATIEVDSVPYGIILYKNTSITYNILRVMELNIFTIEIVDENNNFIDFNNSDWTITLGLNLYRYTPTNSNKTFKDLLMPTTVEKPLDKSAKDSKKEPKKESKKLNEMDLLTYK